jgi:hypothetical protein
VNASSHRPERREFLLRRYPDSGEATIHWKPFDPNKPNRPKPTTGPRSRPAAGVERPVRASAVTRARRYASAYGVVYMWTLTFAVRECDVGRVEREMEKFLRRLQRRTGSLYWMWSMEWHPRRGSLHVHLGLSTYVARSLVESVWGHGIIYSPSRGLVARLQSGGVEAARALVGYLLKKPVTGAKGRAYHTSGGSVRMEKSFHPSVELGVAVAVAAFEAEPQWQSSTSDWGALRWLGRFADCAPVEPEGRS